jgi:hypothetical protein
MNSIPSSAVSHQPFSAPAPSPKRASQRQPSRFAQAAVACLERVTLYLVGSFLLPFDVSEELVRACRSVRCALGLAASRHPFMSLRDWPDDPKAGEALGSLLKRLDELEHEL